MTHTRVSRKRRIQHPRRFFKSMGPSLVFSGRRRASQRRRSCHWVVLRHHLVRHVSSLRRLLASKKWWKETSLFGWRRFSSPSFFRRKQEKENQFWNYGARTPFLGDLPRRKGFGRTFTSFGHRKKAERWKEDKKRRKTILTVCRKGKNNVFFPTFFCLFSGVQKLLIVCPQFPDHHPNFRGQLDVFLQAPEELNLILIEKYKKNVRCGVWQGQAQSVERTSSSPPKRGHLRQSGLPSVPTASTWIQWRISQYHLSKPPSRSPVGHSKS